MSIKEKGKEINTPDDSLIIEEEFDIVPAGSGQKTSISKHILNICIITLVLTFFFGLGRYSYLVDQRKNVVIRNGVPKETSLSGSTSLGEVKGVRTGDESVVASKSGTKYHFPWCTGAKQISEANKIVFPSPEEARKAGYTPASNCKGLK